MLVDTQILRCVGTPQLRKCLRKKTRYFLLLKQLNRQKYRKQTIQFFKNNVHPDSNPRPLEHQSSSTCLNQGKIETSFPPQKNLLSSKVFATEMDFWQMLLMPETGNDVKYRTGSAVWNGQRRVSIENGKSKKAREREVVGACVFVC